MYRTCCSCGASIGEEDTCPACDRGFCDDCLTSVGHECMEQVDVDRSGSRLPFGWSRRRHVLAWVQGLVVATLLFIASGLTPFGLGAGLVLGPIIGYVHLMFPRYVPSFSH